MRTAADVQWQGSEAEGWLSDLKGADRQVQCDATRSSHRTVIAVDGVGQKTLQSRCAVSLDLRLCWPNGRGQSRNGDSRVATGAPNHDQSQERLLPSGTTTSLVSIQKESNTGRQGDRPRESDCSGKVEIETRLAQL
jgi:hypothetical protein